MISELAGLEIEPPPLTPATILIVDDDPVNRQILSNLFTGKRYILIEAANGLDAITTAKEERPDVILLDIIMPGMDGYEVCASLNYHDVTAAIPVIMISSLQSAEDETRGLEAGAVDFISKPFNPVAVKAKVRAHLQLKKHQDAINNKCAQLSLSNKLLEQEILDHLQTSQNLVSARNEIEAANRVKDGLIKDLFQAMCEMLSSRDLYTFEHGLRVASISRLIGETMGLPDKELEALELGCLLHDISKVAIPDDVLLKPGVFDAQDRKIMRLHPTLGAKIFMRQSCDPQIIDIIHHHHERLDGSGYPDGLQGDEITVLARIAMVADTYEALVARRPYKRPMKRMEALSTLQVEVTKGRLDPVVVEAIVKVTENWDPLELGHNYSDSNTEILEMFRKKTYFKEPLSDFYNYRYLFFLEDSGVLEASGAGYTLMKVSFLNLDHLNRVAGYLKTDQFIDEIGSRLHKTLEEEALDDIDGCTSILLRKGTSYIIYSNCQQDILTELLTKIEQRVNSMTREWVLEPRIVMMKFPKQQTIETAVYKLLDSN